jgi:hypothetical protein
MSFREWRDRAMNKQEDTLWAPPERLCREALDKLVRIEVSSLEHIIDFGYQHTAQLDNLLKIQEIKKTIIGYLKAYEY